MPVIDNIPLPKLRAAISRLMLNGSTVSEHIACLSESRTLLVSGRGMSEKVRRLAQNIPTQRSRSGLKPKINIAEFWSILDRSADRVILDWYGSKLANENGAELRLALARLNDDPGPIAAPEDEVWEDAPKDERYGAWRTVLLDFCRDSPGRETLEFLDLGVEHRSSEAKEAALALNVEDAVSNNQELLQSTISLIRDLKSYDSTTFIRKVKELNINTETKSVLEEFYKSHREEIARIVAVSGDDGETNAESSPATAVSEVPLGNIVGAVEKKRNKSDYEIRILGYFKLKKLFIFSTVQLKNFFGGPKIHSTARVDGEFEEGEVSLWQLRSNSKTGGPSRFSVVRREDRWLDIIPIPFDISDHSGARGWILNSYQAKGGVYPIFKTTDNRYIAHSKFQSKYILDDFAQPLNVSDKVLSYRFNDGQLRTLVSMCGFRDSINIVPAELKLRNYLRMRAGSANNQLNNEEHISVLLRRVLESKDSLPEDLKYSQEFFANLEKNSQLFEEIVEILLEHPVVVRRIEMRAADEIAAAKSQLESLERDILRLDRELAEKQSAINQVDSLLEREKQSLIKELDIQRNNLEEEFRKQVLKFSNEEIKSISQSLLYRMVLGEGSSYRTESVVSTESNIQDRFQELTEHFDGVHLIRDGKALEAALTLIASSTGIIHAILKAITHSLIAEGVCIVCGRDSQELSKAVAQLISGGVVCNVHVRSDFFSLEDILQSPAELEVNGEIYPMSLADSLVVSQSRRLPTLLRISSFNLIPPESYLGRMQQFIGVNSIGRRLTWSGSSGIRSIEIKSPVYLLLESTSGSSTHPVGSDFADFISVFLTESLFVQSELSLAAQSASFMLCNGLLSGPATSLGSQFVDLSDVESSSLFALSKTIARQNASVEAKITNDASAMSGYLEAVSRRLKAGYFSDLFRV